MFDEDPFAKSAQDMVKIFHEVLIIMKFLQSKPQVKSMKRSFFVFVKYCY